MGGGPSKKKGETSSPSGGQPKCSPKKDVPIDGVVCKVDDMKDGEMKVYDVGEGRVLLIRDKGNFHAIGAKCTHYGAPLVKGALCNGRIRCPWHGACFDIKTGDIEDFPGLDSLPRFDVEIIDGSVKIHGTDSLLSSTRRLKQMECASGEDDRMFLLIGGGYATVVCAETLRQEGFKGKIVIATNEPHLPYDRPKLSKACNAKAEEISLRNPEFYSVYDIEVQVKKKAVSVDTMLKTVSYEDGSSTNYHKLMIATGADPRSLDQLEGHDLENITALRNLDEAHLVAEQGKGKNVVVIGTSFIGLEVASYLIGKATSVTLVGLKPEPLQPILGTKVGCTVRKLFEDKGAKFVWSVPVKFVGSGKKIKEIVLEDGTQLPADLCVIGIGVKPASNFLKEASIALSQQGYVMVDKFMKTSRDDIYAAGDLTEFPLFIAGDAKVNIQHWQMAGQQGRIAALNMLGKDVEIRSVPFFWTVLFGKSLRYTGYGVGYDDIIIQGDLEGLKFIAYYTKGESVVAVASMNFDPIVAQAAEMFNAGKTISKEEVSGIGPQSWVTRLQDV